VAWLLLGAVEVGHGLRVHYLPPAPVESMPAVPSPAAPR
jgi:hypothetical protein